MSKRLESAAEAETIATELGLAFQLIIDPNHEIPRNGFTTGDPDTVYLFDPGCKIYFAKNQDPVDAKLYWKGRVRTINWGQRTKASLRKSLIEDDAMECAVCLEETTGLVSAACPLCHGNCCPRCLLKVALTDETVAHILQGEHLIDLRCFQCREPMHGDIRGIYHWFDWLYSFTFENRKHFRIVLIKKS